MYLYYQIEEGKGNHHWFRDTVGVTTNVAGVCSSGTKIDRIHGQGPYELLCSWAIHEKVREDTTSSFELQEKGNRRGNSIYARIGQDSPKSICIRKHILGIMY